MLRVGDVVCGYVQGSRVLDGLSLTIGHGEVVALLGRNGMGKSTLLRTITGHLKPASGNITMGERDITGLPPYRIARAGVGYVPQGREIFADFTVEENLRLGVLGKAELANQVPAWAFDLFPVLAERRTQRAGTMSGGQQQQLAIMRALVGAPSLVLLDEPSEGIQPSIVHDIGGALRRYAEGKDLSILLVEQNLDLVLMLATRVLFIENGRIVEESTDMSRLSTDASLINRYLSV
ncbi:MAG: ABC transporter ATP-binding protein [Alphaproteobacteria bacterium]|nr:ABC transporter ATP-binding protein [Alphaproteobacteria bacterium]